jgi:hypothetical protein
VPVISYISPNAERSAADALPAGADEVLRGELTEREAQLGIVLVRTFQRLLCPCAFEPI